MEQASTRPLVAAMIAGGVLLGAALPGQAAVIALNYDPVYGTAFPNLGWRVTADLYVDPGCTMTPGQPWLRIASPACQLSKVDDVVLYFYNTSAPTIVEETLVIGTYGADSGAWSYAVDATQELVELEQSGGNPVGFKTSWSTWKSASNTLLGVDDFSFALRLSLELGGEGDPLVNLAQLVHKSTESGFTPEGQFETGDRSTGTVRTRAQRFSGPDSAYVPRALGQFEPNLQYTAVPEPGSAALVLVALLAAAAAAGRRRQA